jgi:hypothetical protein
MLKDGFRAWFAQAKIEQMQALNGAVTLWDLDWPVDRVITTTAEVRGSMLRLLERDLAWLQSVKVMDYSVMIGVEEAGELLRASDTACAIAAPRSTPRDPPPGNADTGCHTGVRPPRP